MTQIRKSKGFSLVEVLIALVIMSVGMLGIAGLYVQSMQAGRTSMLRHHAVTLAGDVADRIRANPTAAAAYTVAAGANHNCVAMGADCDSIEMAAHDILLWQQQALRVPAADGRWQPAGRGGLRRRGPAADLHNYGSLGRANAGRQPTAYSITVPVNPF